MQGRQNLSLRCPAELAGRQNAVISAMISNERIASAFDGIAPHAAILDSNGVIVHVNSAWRRFAVENDCPDPKAYLGQSYLDIVGRSASSGDTLASEALSGIEGVISGALQRFSQRYPCHAPGVERWFIMTVTRALSGGDFVVAHDAVTELVQAERRSADVERRLKLSLEAGRMGAFEVDLGEKEISFDAKEAELLGLPKASRRLNLADFNAMMNESDAEPLETLLAGAGDRYAGELRLKLADATEHWLSFAAARQNHGTSDAGRYFGISFDVTPRKLLEERNRLLTREVRHRAKNLLAVAAAIARQTAGKKDPEAFADEFAKRVAALGSTLTLLSREERQGVDIRELIETHFEPFAEARAQIVLSGASVIVRPEAAQMIGIAVHELATNALKYGALACSSGRISIEWLAQDAPHGGAFSLSWTETGGPDVKPAAHKGFGYSVLMEQTAWALRGDVEAQYPRSGLVWKLSAPVEEVLADEPRH
jgi:two-component sensor histidine kinase